MTSHSLKTYSLLCTTVLLLACGQAPQNAPGGGLPSVYKDPDNLFSIRYPDGWTVKRNHHLVSQHYETDGTAILAPIDKTKNTLYEGIFHVATMDECPVIDNAKSVDIHGTMFLHSTWDEAAAGNRYEGETYTSQRKNNCVVVTLFAHSCNLSSEDCGPTNPEKYDRVALFGTLHQMMESLKILQE